MLIPPVAFDEIDGLARYSAEPTVRTSTDRGVYQAERIEKVTYVAESWGFYTLPAVRLTWFNPQDRKAHEAVTDPVKFRARAKLALGVSTFGDPAALAPKLLWLLVLFASVGAGFWYWQRARARGRTRVATAPTGPSEWRLFKAARAAARGGNPLETINATYRWVRHAPANAAHTFAAFGGHHDRFQSTFAQLQRAVFGKEGTAPSTETLDDTLRLTRKQELTPAPLSPDEWLNP